jgi:hypothetical protein
MTSGIAASPCSTWAGRPGLGSASLSATTTSSTARTYTHVVADERELDYEEMLQ